MKTMISNLPDEMVEEILSRVPHERMGEVRLTCKKWNDLSNTQSFREMHIAKASKEGECEMIALMEDDLYLTSFFIVDGDDLSFEHKSKHSFPNEQVRVEQVHHCKGLLLCVLRDDPRLLVWNMYLRERRWIKPRFSYRPKGWDLFSYALGYEDNKKDGSCRLKLLKFIDNYAGDQFFWYEMYDFESCLWTTLDITPHWLIESHNSGVSLKGNITYWCAGDRKLDYGDMVDDRIICFDFTSERFGQLLPLPFSTVRTDDYVTLSCFGEDKLTVLLEHPGKDPSELEIWITTKIEEAAGEVFCWIKLLRFGKLVPFPRGVFFTNEEKNIAMSFFSQLGIRKGHKFKINGYAGCYRKLDHVSGDRHGMAYLCPYVPSLLSVQGGRKQLSESENLTVVVTKDRDLVQLKRIMIDTPSS